MGEHRMTRWLEQSCEQDLTEKLLWNRLITFLEKEVKIQQQKMMLQRPKSDENQRESKDKNERSRYPINKSFFSGSESEVPICFICGARARDSDHIATSGPGGSKVVQYFSCKEFAEKHLPKDSLSENQRGTVFSVYCQAHFLSKENIRMAVANVILHVLISLTIDIHQKSMS